MSPEASSAALQGAFRALADPTRRDILILLSHRDMTVGEVSSRFDMTRAAVKKHLTILHEGHFVSVEKKGRERINRLEPLALKEVANWLNYFNRFWDDRLAALKDAVINEQTKKKENKK